MLMGYKTHLSRSTQVTRLSIQQSRRTVLLETTAEHLQLILTSLLSTYTVHHHRSPYPHISHLKHLCFRHLDLLFLLPLHPLPKSYQTAALLAVTYHLSNPKHYLVNQLTLLRNMVEYRPKWTDWAQRRQQRVYLKYIINLTYRLPRRAGSTWRCGYHAPAAIHRPPPCSTFPTALTISSMSAQELSFPPLKISKANQPMKKCIAAGVTRSFPNMYVS